MDFAAGYDAAGNLITQVLPGRVTARTSFDVAGEPVGLTYTGAVQPVTARVDAAGDPVLDADGRPVYDADGPPQPDQPWLAWTVTNDAQGRVRAETTGPAAGFDGNPGVSDPAHITPYDVGHATGYDRGYSYDPAGRLATVTDHTATGPRGGLDAAPCTVRGYGFDGNGRRVSLTTTTRPDGDCAATTGSRTSQQTPSIVFRDAIAVGVRGLLTSGRSWMKARRIW